MRGHIVRSVSLALAIGAVACGVNGTEPASPKGRQSLLHQAGTPPRLPDATAKFTTFETGQVRPLALSPSGKLLFAVNTPDNRLEIFAVKKDRLEPLSSVAVGLEPTAVAARSDEEVWVVNHLSDSVSIVKVEDGESPRVVRTLLVGDEPRDIVFAGRQRERAFITTAHRGQNSPVDPQLTTPGIGRADVFVFDANKLGDSLGGTPLTVLTLFADTPRALAVTPDGKTVYAAAFNSGNQTTVVAKGSVDMGGGLPAPTTITLATPEGPLTIPQPGVGLIVKYRDGHWVDRTGRNWDAFVKLHLPDKDVFAIDATANPPKQTQIWTSVGSTLFSLAVNPVSGKVYVANIDARNDVRFEGRGHSLPAGGDRTVRGRIADSQITVLDGERVVPRHLNKHINYEADFTPGERERSLAFPQGMAVTSDGKTLFVAALGSDKVGVFSSAELENDTFVPDPRSHIQLTGGGPTGLVLNEKRGVLYVMTRFDNGISIVDLNTRREISHLRMFNPEPPSVVNGRRLLYDAADTSNHGDAACASCHIFADFDGLAWDLGDPDGFPIPIPGPFAIEPAQILALLPFTAPVFAAFQPLKGPMTTQSLRGMDNHGAMHWRGDRHGGFDRHGNPVPAQQPNGGVFSEDAAFKAFNVAFPGLLGRPAPLTPQEMQAFTDFILQVSYPPNPIRNLDNSLTLQQKEGRDFYFASFTDSAGNTHELPSDRFHNCNGCHTLDPTANAEFGIERPGFFGTDGRYSFENETQIFKVPHLRNMYQKVGMFGMSPDPLIPSTLVPGGVPHMGDQIRGFGFQHDGAIDTIERFFRLSVFIKTTEPSTNPGGPSFPEIPPNPFGIPDGDQGLPLRRALESFMFAFDSNLAPIVGQQITLGPTNAALAMPRIRLLQTRAALGECDLVVRGRVGGEERGWLFSQGLYRPDSAKEASVGEQALLQRAGGAPLTFTCVPPGAGVQVALDRDGDGYADRDERLFGTDPANPLSHP
jgi:DNA-binding beta-propeller fold protein YncE